MRSANGGRHPEGALVKIVLLTVAALLAIGGEALAAQPGKPRPRGSSPSPASGAIDVTVVEVAGTHAYLQPGARGGVRRGAKVSIGGKSFVVVDATDSYAVVDLGKETVHEQDRGKTSLEPEEAAQKVELPKPHPLATWEQAWTEEPAPASKEAPRYVPLGEGERDRRWDVRLLAAGGALVPLGHGTAIGQSELNARVHAEPITAPLAFDLDVSVQRWYAGNLDARDGGPARPLIWLRQALVGYGSGGWYAGAGRMLYAASTLGALDGARVAAPLGGGFGIGAFGGLLPDPLSGAPAADAERFGVEATFSRPDLSLRPESALVVHGSTFGGKLDERRVSGVFGLYPGLSRVGGHFEVSNFDRDNPWRAPSVALTAGGLDASVRFGPVELGVRGDVRQPVRSQWLASFLPLTWFCRTVPTAGGPDVCDGSVSTRALGELDAALDLGNAGVTVGAQTIGDLSQSGGAPDAKGVFASGRVLRIARVLRVEASGNIATGSYLDMFGGSAGPGVSLFGDTLDASAYYRYAGIKYAAGTSATQHGVGSTVLVFPRAELLFTVQGEAIAGDDVKALQLFGTALWRPKL
jgi:hypothetical protein